MDTQLAGVKLDSTTIKPDSSIQIPSAVKSHSPTPSQVWQTVLSLTLSLCRYNNYYASGLECLWYICLIINLFVDIKF